MARCRRRVPDAGEVLVKADTIGVSMPEILVRNGTYAWMPPLPAIPGIEMSGTIAETGSDVTGQRGRPERFRQRPRPAGARRLLCRVYRRPGAGGASAAFGCRSRSGRLPVELSGRLAPAAHGRAGRRGAPVLVHTAAGGVGSAAVQLALIAGMRVIGVAGCEAKRQAVLGLGAAYAFNYRTDDVVALVREATSGGGADLILDPIGGKGFGRNFAMLAPLGLVISYGRLDGPPDPSFVQAMREHHAVSPAVRFFTIHSFDRRPDIREVGDTRADRSPRRRPNQAADPYKAAPGRGGPGPPDARIGRGHRQNSDEAVATRTGQPRSRDFPDSVGELVEMAAELLQCKRKTENPLDFLFGKAADNPVAAQRREFGAEPGQGLMRRSRIGRRRRARQGIAHTDKRVGKQGGGGGNRRYQPLFHGFGERRGDGARNHD